MSAALAVIVLGSAVSLAYYLRVVAAIWAPAEPESRALTPTGQPVIAGGAGGVRHPLAAAVAVVCLIGIVAFGIFPQPMFDAAQDAGAALGNLL